MLRRGRGHGIIVHYEVFVQLYTCFFGPRIDSFFEDFLLCLHPSALSVPAFPPGGALRLRLALKIMPYFLNGPTENISVPKMTLLDVGEDVFGFALDIFVMHFTYTSAQDVHELSSRWLPHPKRGVCNSFAKEEGSGSASIWIPSHTPATPH